jgi:predicted nucleic acid-binding protein
VGAKEQEKRVGIEYMDGLLIVDTDISIDAGRSASEAVNYLLGAESRSTLAISAITQMELMVGCQSKTELRAVDRFLARFRIIRLNETITETAITLLRQYRLSHGLLIADALIAATALSIAEPLVTKNQRDYRFISGLSLHSYP